MFKDLTYKQKNKYLIIVSLVFMLLIYVFALKNTFKLISDNSRLYEQLELIANAPEKMRTLQVKLNELDKQLGPFMYSDSLQQEYILELVSQFCAKNKLTLKEFPGSLIESKGDYDIETNVMKVSGRFQDLIKLVYNLEQELRIGKIASVDFETLKNRRTKRTYLLSTIYLQSIKKRSHEES